MRPLLTALLVLLNMAIAHAQYSAGLKAGLNYSTMIVYDGVSDYGYLPGFQVGGFVDYSLAKVSFQLDVVYSQQGASITSNAEDLKAIAKYINIPVAVKYKLGPSFNVQVAPQIGFLTCMKSDYHPVVSISFDEQTYTKAYKKTDFGVNVGAGWKSSNGIIVDVRYYLGLTEINDYPGLAPTKNSMVHLTVGYEIFKF